ncbi:MAG: SAM-dependent methyltransferase [Treponema sp.]|nr:SAM-dependent methyltransferase [Treponema sp.]
MILFATFSNPAKNAKNEFDREYLKIKIQKLHNLNHFAEEKYFAEFFTKTQVFHKHFSKAELDDFIKKHAGTTFKNCVYRTETEEITILANKKGKTTELRKSASHSSAKSFSLAESASKNYLLQEGTPVDFLVELGIMNKDGKVLAAKYNKFKQINRYLEFVNDVFEKMQALHKDENLPLNIIDFGSGKSYLTFAVYYFFVVVKKCNVKICGLDLRSDVIATCNKIAQKLNYENLSFEVGDVAHYKSSEQIDLMITLHACDTATDYALKFASEHNCSVILSVPCCQHEINGQLSGAVLQNEFSSFQKYGIVKERFASLVTDLCRADFLEQNGYSVQLLEFIDLEYTAKNILIRAVKKLNQCESNIEENETSVRQLVKKLSINPTIFR